MNHLHIPNVGLIGFDSWVSHWDILFPWGAQVSDLGWFHDTIPVFEMPVIIFAAFISSSFLITNVVDHVSYPKPIILIYFLEVSVPHFSQWVTTAPPVALRPYVVERSKEVEFADCCHASSRLNPPIGSHSDSENTQKTASADSENPWTSIKIHKKSIINQ